MRRHLEKQLRQKSDKLKKRHFSRTLPIRRAELAGHMRHFVMPDKRSEERQHIDEMAMANEQ